MSFTFNGVNCESMGMFVEKYPSRSFPTKKVTTYNILGRNGDLIVEHGGYNNVIQPYEVYINHSGIDMQSNLKRIAFWLLYTVSGYATLTDTYDPSVYREARVIGGEEFLNSLNEFGRATLKFDCKPQRFLVTPEIITGQIPISSASPAQTVINITSHTDLCGGLPYIKLSKVPLDSKVKIWNNSVKVFSGQTKTTGNADPVEVDCNKREYTGNFVDNSVYVDWEAGEVGANDFKNEHSAITVIVERLNGTSIPYNINITIDTQRYSL